MASKQCMPWLCSSIKVQKSFTSQYRWTWWTLLPKRLFSCRFLHFHAKFAVLSVAREARAVLRKALPLVPRPSPPSRASGTAGQVARCRENPPRGPPWRQHSLCQAEPSPQPSPVCCRTSATQPDTVRGCRGCCCCCCWARRPAARGQAGNSSPGKGSVSLLTLHCFKIDAVSVAWA